jgi:hypothetical protein
VEGYKDYYVKKAVSGTKNSAGLVRSRAKPPPSGKKWPAGKRVGSGQLLKKATELGAAATTTLYCLFCENEFSTQGVRSRSRLALTTIKSRDWT